VIENKVRSWGLLALDHQQPSGGQRPRQPDPIAAAASSKTATRGPGATVAMAS